MSKDAIEDAESLERTESSIDLYLDGWRCLEERKGGVMKIYMVENVCGYQRTIAAIFAQKEDAEGFVESLENPTEWDIVERTLWYGQPPNRGYNE